MAAEGAASLEALRERIRALEGGARVCRRRAPSGVSAVDAWIGGLPRPGILEICGPMGAGRSRLALQLVAAATRQGLVAWVDPLRAFYPPAAEASGVDLARLLLVCPPAASRTARAQVHASRTARDEVWAVEQLLRSGCFGLVVVALPERGAARRSASHGWARAAEQGQCTAVVLGQRPIRELPADVRLAVDGERMVVLRDRVRNGSSGTEALLPPWPEGADPWG